MARNRDFRSWLKILGLGNQGTAKISPLNEGLEWNDENNRRKTAKQNEAGERLQKKTNINREVCSI